LKNRLLKGESEGTGRAEGAIFVEYSTAGYRIIDSVVVDFIKPAEILRRGLKAGKTKRPDF